MKGSVFLVLGGTGGIGSALARRRSAAAARVVLAARDESRLGILAGEVGGHPYRLDATRTAEVEACVADAAARFGRLDGIANCVGSLLLKPAHLTTDEEWDSTIAANLRTAFAAVRAGGRALEAGGSIVLVSSAAARIGLANHEAIAAAKAGVDRPDSLGRGNLRPQGRSRERRGAGAGAHAAHRPYHRQQVRSSRPRRRLGFAALAGLSRV